VEYALIAVRLWVWASVRASARPAPRHCRRFDKFTSRREYLQGSSVHVDVPSRQPSIGSTMKRSLLAISIAAGFIGAAHAGQAANDAATHFLAIASGDLSVLMRGYNDAAQLQWLGGPLDGSYAGAAAIRGVWEKFGKAQGPLKATVESVEESANPRGATVTANVLFVGKAPIKVRHVLVYRDNLIVSETWQIDPKLVVRE
jgi:hypothetical protein